MLSKRYGMTGQPQQGLYLITVPELVAAEQNLFSFRERRKEWAAGIQSRPYQSERDTHWRDLFVSDLRSSIKWDAEHGNPELFKAVVTLDKHYNTFSVEQHDKQVRDKVLESVAGVIRQSNNISSRGTTRILHPIWREK